ncbi:hypothetical protein JCM10908_005045 [Rhodotorula pacifica]|uniref:Rrn7p n=1 Tax=Rhodotorula pacifica TaxID=1495444 RepID=UPI00316D81E3
MAKRPRCPVCRSKRWHRDGLSGAVVCEEGHLLAGYVQETTETQEGPSQHTQTTRRIRKNRTRKQKPPQNDHFHGDREKFLLWQAMQLILREQLRVLIDEMGWPVELEAVTRDLWSLLVASSGEKAVPPAPRDYHLDDEPAASYSGPRKGDRYNRAGRKPYGKRGFKKDPDLHGGGGGAGGEDEEGEAGGGGRREQEEENGSDGGDASATEGERDTTRGGEGGDEPQSDADSDADSYFSEDQDADDERAPPNSSKRRSSSRRGSPVVGTGAPSSPGLGPMSDPPAGNNVKAFGRAGRFPAHKRRRIGPPPARSDDPRDQPRLEYTLLVTYLACITLKLPIMLGDLFHLADTYQILYLDAVLHLPAEMQAHLPKRSRDLLSPKSTPHLYSHNISFERLSPDDAGTAQGTLARLVSMYREDWQVEFSEANVPLLLARICRSWLALPPQAYHLSLALLSYLPSPPSFYLPASLQLSHANTASGPSTGGWPRHRTGSQDWRVALPEIKLASVVVVLCRLMWDLESEGAGQDRPPDAASIGSSSTSPLSAFLSLPSRDAWLDTIERLAQLDQPGDPSPLWTQEVVDMHDEEIDAYLDFFESKIVSKEKVPSRMENVSRFFPPPLDEDMPEKQTTEPGSFLQRAAAMIATLYDGAAPMLEDQSDTFESASTTLSSVFSAISGRQNIAFCTTDLPSPLSRLLSVLASRLTPLPSSLKINLRGPAPSHATTGITNLLPFIDQVERALVAGADASPATEQYAPLRRASPKDVRKQAEQERRDRTKQEKERRRAIDRLRGVPLALDGIYDAADGGADEEGQVVPSVRVRLEDQYGREIEMARHRARTIKSKETIDSEDELEAELGMAEAAEAADEEEEEGMAAMELA